MKPRSNNLGLDIVRSASIVLVLFGHTADWWLGPGQGTAIVAAAVAGAAVEAFFSLSGFLIGGILIAHIEPGVTGRTLRRFWTRRWMRTLPAYWVMLAGLNLYFGTHDWRSLLFLQAFVPRTEWTPLTIHTWSLVLEEWFYLFVPLILFAAVRLLGRSRQYWAVPAVCGTLLLLCSVERWTAQLHPSPFWGPDWNINPVLRLDCAAWGVLGVWAVRQWPLSRALAAALLAGGGLLFLALIGVTVLTYYPQHLWGYAHWASAWAAMHATLQEFAAACIVIGLHRLVPRGAGAGAWLIGATARLSYSLYLLHIPVIFLSRAAGLDDAAGWAPRLIMLALIVAASLVMRFGVELPVLALRDLVAPDRRALRLQPTGVPG